MVAFVNGISALTSCNILLPIELQFSWRMNHYELDLCWIMLFICTQIEHYESV